MVDANPIIDAINTAKAALDKMTLSARINELLASINLVAKNPKPQYRENAKQRIRAIVGDLERIPDLLTNIQAVANRTMQKMRETLETEMFARDAQWQEWAKHKEQEIANLKRQLAPKTNVKLKTPASKTRPRRSEEITRHDSTPKKPFDALDLLGMLNNQILLSGAEKLLSPRTTPYDVPDKFAISPTAVVDAMHYRELGLTQAWLSWIVHITRKAIITQRQIIKKQLQANPRPGIWQNISSTVNEIRYEVHKQATSMKKQTVA